MQKLQLVGFWKWQKRPLSFHISPRPLELHTTIKIELSYSQPFHLNHYYSWLAVVVIQMEWLGLYITY